MTRDYRKRYISKMNRMGATPYDRAFKLKQREFAKFFENALNKEPCVIDGVETHAIFQDHSQSNNKDLSDDKYVVLPNETKAGIGSYIEWRAQDWLVFTEEAKTIPTHQQMKVKIVNWNIKWKKRDGSIAEHGAYVQNQTLYTLGVAYQGDLISVVNGKMMMYMQNNEDTDSITIGTRVFIGKDVYKILFADTVSRSGLINFLMEEDTMTEYDNEELGIADYYRDMGEVDDDDGGESSDSKIVGDEVARIGSTHTYSISDGKKVSEWIVESIDGNAQPVYTLERDEDRMVLQYKDDFRYVGETMNIIAQLSDGEILSHTVRVIKKF